MKNIKKIVILSALMIAVVGCGAVPTLKNGEQKVASLNNGGISAEDLYEEMKEKYSGQVFADLIDTEILNKKYKETDEEKEYIDTQIDSIKSSAKEYNMSYTELLKNYGFENTSDLKEQLKLIFRRDKAVSDYLKDNLTNSEIKNYYKDEVYGKIRAKHILISPDTSDDMTSEEKANAEKKAKAKAEEIIKKIKKGEDFSKLAKKYSDDPGSAKKGGDLGWFSTGTMLEEFDNAAFKLKKGKYTTSPVKTSRGYHIILKVDEKEKPKLEDVKKKIKEDLASQKLEKDPTLYQTTLDNVRKDAGMKFEDSELKKAYNKYLQDAKAKASQSQQSSN